MSQGIGEVGSSGNVSSVGSSAHAQASTLFSPSSRWNCAAAKDSALDYIEQVEKAQADQKEVADMLSKLRNLQENAANEKKHLQYGDVQRTARPKTIHPRGRRRKSSQGGRLYCRCQEVAGAGNLKTKENYEVSEEYESTMMPDVMEQYFKDNDIDYDDSGVSARQNGSEWQRAIDSLEDRKAALEVFAYMDTYGLAYSTGSSKDDLDTAIQSLQAHQETIGTDIQTLMVYVQDYMGQYNSYTQGANSAIQSALQTLTNVARGQ